MRALVLIFFCFHILGSVKAQGPRISIENVYHQFNNVSANHFPNYFSNTQVETYILNETTRRLALHFNASRVVPPVFVEVARDDRYGRRRNIVTVPEASEFDLFVSILSIISKDPSSLNKTWTFDIQVRSATEVVLSKRVEHLLEPYTATGHLTQVRWLSQQEFAAFFLTAVDELLDNMPLRSNPIKLGNDQYINNLIDSNIPGFQTQLLTVNGGFVTGSNVGYAIDGKNERLSAFTYSNRGWRARNKEDFDQRSKEVLQIVMGAEPQGEVARTLIRNGMFTTDKGSQLRLRYDRITFRSGREFQSAPDFIQLYEDEKLSGRLYFFSKPNEDPLALYGYRDEGSFGWGDRHYLQGELNNKIYIVEFDEQLGVVYFMSETETEAIVLLQNLNPLSRSFGGLLLSANNRRILLKASTSADVNAEDAEWYALFTKPETTTASLQDYAQLFGLLFFALAAN